MVLGQDVSGDKVFSCKSLLFLIFECLILCGVQGWIPFSEGRVGDVWCRVAGSFVGGGEKGLGSDNYEEDRD